jgi:hypothetical protein
MKPLNRIVIISLLLLMPLTAGADINQWSGSGPFAPGPGNQIITTLAISPDGKTVYAGTGSGTVLSYTYAAPDVITDTVGNISAGGATLNGAVSANNHDATVSFEYGLAAIYGSSIDATPKIVAGTLPTPVSAAITGLACNTAYHYRAKATNSGGAMYGSDATFTTAACPSSLLTVSTVGSGVIHSSSQTHTGIPGDISCSGNAGTCGALYPTGEKVTLSATPEGATSIFDRWGLDCLGQGNPCILTLDDARSATAIFTTAPLAKNSTTGVFYPTLEQALGTANVVTPDTLLLLGISYSGLVTLDKGINLKGGWDTLYRNLTGMPTTLNGGLTVVQGTSSLENIDVTGKLTIKGGILRVKGVKVK